MPDSRSRFTDRAMALRDQQAAFNSALDRTQQRIEEATMEASTVPLRDEPWFPLGYLRDGWIIRTTSVDGGLWATQPTIGPVLGPEPPPDPTDWWGGCGHPRCTCLAGPYYRDNMFRNIIPGTEERRGYCLTVKQGRRRVERFWQASSERRARAYQAQFFPNEKVLSVRRTRTRRRGQRVERYVPEQCNVMLAGVTFEIDDNKVY